MRLVISFVLGIFAGLALSAVIDEHLNQQDQMLRRAFNREWE